MHSILRACWLLAVAATLATAAPSYAADVEGSSDHPLVGRYEGAEIVYYRAADFDEAALLAAPLDYGTVLAADKLKDRSAAEWLKLEGKLTQIRYAGPAGRSSLEIYRNFQSSLAGKGFAPVFECTDQECLTGSFKDFYVLGEQIDTNNNLSTAYFDHARYLLSKLDRPEGAVYASILIGQSQDEVTTFVQVVETKGMEGDKIVFLDAGQMQTAIEESGSVSLYGILFDLDKATLKPESKPTLDEIATLLRNRPELRLAIVGHTDNQGSAEYNLDLSNRRAASVVEALTRDYGVDPGRLSASGAGMSSPVASNATEEGRAKNRRVALVAQ